MKERIRQRARELLFDGCRFTTAAAPHSATQFEQWLAKGFHGEMSYLQRNAHKRVDPQQVLAEAKSIITLAVSYGRASQTPGAKRNSEAESGSATAHGEASFTPSSSEVPPPAGIIAGYACYSDYHQIVGERLRALADFVNRLGDGTQSLWYVDTGPLLERDLAQRAGLGFIGKHTNLISRRLGNWFFVSEIITSLELEPDEAETNRCGTCARCIAACPTAAIRAPFQLDARRCISYLTIELKGAIPLDLRPAIGNRIYGCDDCLAVCPWNRFAREGAMMKPHSRDELAQPDLLELLTLDQTQFKRRFANTPMLRAKRRGLLRNVCVALGNIGNEAALPALYQALNENESLIQEHAQWAINRIQDRAAS